MSSTLPPINEHRTKSKPHKPQSASSPATSSSVRSSRHQTPQPQQHHEEAGTDPLPYDEDEEDDDDVEKFVIDGGHHDEHGKSSSLRQHDDTEASRSSLSFKRRGKLHNNKFDGESSEGGGSLGAAHFSFSSHTQKQKHSLTSAKYLDESIKLGAYKDSSKRRKEAAEVRSQLQKMFRALDAIDDEFNAKERRHTESVMSKPIVRPKPAAFERYHRAKEKEKLRKEKRKVKELKKKIEEEERRMLLAGGDVHGKPPFPKRRAHTSLA